jgi:hypothetical protein
LVTVIQPYHPLYGQQVEVIRLRQGKDPDLIVRLPDGFHAAIAMSLTDYAAPATNITQSSVSPPLLDFFGLCQAARFIEQLRQAGRDRATGAHIPCDTDRVDYDGSG